MTQIKDVSMLAKERTLIRIAKAAVNVLIANIKLFSFFALLAIIRDSDRGWAISSFASCVYVSYGGPIFVATTPPGGDIPLEILFSFLFVFPFFVMSTAISIGMSLIKYKSFLVFFWPLLFLGYGCLYLIWYLVGHVPL